MLKQGREVKTNISDVFRTSYGTVDMSTLKSIFLNLSTWAEPLEEKECWVRPIKKFKNDIKNTVHRQLKHNIKSMEIASPITNLTNTIIKESLLSSTIFKFHTTKK